MLHDGVDVSGSQRLPALIGAFGQPWAGSGEPTAPLFRSEAIASSDVPHP